MILRGLRVEAFGGLNPGAQVASFSPQITILHGPNQLGKSTLFRALTYGLYQRHGVTGEQVEREILPVGTSVSPRVAITFELQGTTYRITKQFLKRPQAVLEQQKGEIFEVLAESSAADEHLRELLGSAFAGRGLTQADQRGMGEVLMVDQGTLRLGTSLGERVQHDLRGIIGAVGTTEAALGLLRRAKARYDAIFTPGGELKRGQQAPPLSRIEAELEDVERQRAALETSLREAAELEERLAARAASNTDFAPAEQQLRAEIERARQGQLHLARREAEVSAHAERVGRQRQDATDFAARLTALIAARDQLASATRRVEAQLSARDRLEAQLAEAERSLREAEAALELLQADQKSVESHGRELSDAIRAGDLSLQVETAQAQLEQQRSLTEQVATLEARLVEKARPTREQLQRLRRYFDEVRELVRRTTDLQLRVRVIGEGSSAVETQEKTYALAAGQILELQGADPLVLRVPGVARFELHGPHGLARSELAAELQQRAEELAAECGAFDGADLAQLEALEAERSNLEQEILHLRNRLREQADLPSIEDPAALRAELNHLIERHPSWRGEIPTAGHRASLEESQRDRQARLETDSRDRRGRCERLRAQRDELSRQRLEAELRLTEARVDEASPQAGINALGGDGLSDTERAAQSATLHREAEQQELALSTEQQELAALGDPGSAVRTAETKLQHLLQTQAGGRDQQVRDEHDLERLRHQGLWQQSAVLDERRERLQHDLERERLYVEAVRKLHTSLHDEQQRALDSIAGPLNIKVTRLMQAALGLNLRPQFGERLLPESLVLEDERTLKMDQLSAGTRDQVWLMTRLALGEFYCRSSGRHAFVLDDPLINTDSVRRARILDILARATKDLQVVIFTCHPDHYAGLPAELTSWIPVQETLLTERALPA